jgi:hypothetical protein
MLYFEALHYSNITNIEEEYAKLRIFKLEASFRDRERESSDRSVKQVWVEVGVGIHT